MEHPTKGAWVHVHAAEPIEYMVTESALQIAAMMEDPASPRFIPLHGLLTHDHQMRFGEVRYIDKLRIVAFGDLDLSVELPQPQIPVQ